MNDKFVAELKGFSGCKLELHSTNGEYFVRKISSSRGYNERLKNQMTKQQHFIEKLATQIITAPKIINSGMQGDLFFFDMEYVNGTTIALHIVNASIDELTFLSEQLIKFFISLKNTNAPDNNQQNNANVMFFSESKKKLDSIYLSIKDKHSNDDASGCVLRLKELLEGIDTDLTLKPTFCHGDFTMENILYDPNSKRIYLLDFLDSYINHYWVDITKLFQDIEGKWYEFRDPSLGSTDLSLKIAFIENYLNKKLLFKEGDYIRYHYLFLAIIFARILPYAGDKELPYLTSMINRFIGIYQDSIQLR